MLHISIPAALTIAVLSTAPAFAEQLSCEGAFAIDTSEARMAEIYGRDNVVTGEVMGPEAMTMIATTVFPNDPDKTFRVVWWNEKALKDLSYATVPAADTAPGGLRIGMSVEEVEALNGEPFDMLGFCWDYGGSGSFLSGKLANLPGGCILSFSFSATAWLPAGVDETSISGDRVVRSDLPLLRQLKPAIDKILIGYPWEAFPHAD